MMARLGPRPGDGAAWAHARAAPARRPTRIIPDAIACPNAQASLARYGVPPALTGTRSTAVRGPVSAGFAGAAKARRTGRVRFC